MTRFERPLCLELRPSRILAIFASVLHLAALLAWWRTPVTPLLLIPVTLSLGAYWIYCLRCLCSGGAASALTRLSWDNTRGWRIYSRAQGWRDAELVTPVFVTVHLVIMGFRPGRCAVRRAVVVADRLDREAFRRLRVRLLQSAHGRRN